MTEPECMMVVVWAVDQLCHLVGQGMTWVVKSVVARLHRALPDQLQSHSGGRILLWAEQVRDNRDIFWRCSAHRTGYLNRFPDRS